VFGPRVRGAITFFLHDLTTDASFNEFQLIVCRDVMIQYTPLLQQRVFSLFHHSLPRLGLLALGRGESLRVSPFASHYEEESPRLFRRVR